MLIYLYRDRITGELVELRICWHRLPDDPFPVWLSTAFGIPWRNFNYEEN